MQLAKSAQIRRGAQSAGGLLVFTPLAHKLWTAGRKWGMPLRREKRKSDEARGRIRANLGLAATGVSFAN